MQKIGKKWILLTLVIAASLGMRLLYIRYFPGVIVSPDTYGYYSVGQRILNTMIFSDDFRTPLYPLFLHLIPIFQGRTSAALLSNEFFADMAPVLSIQSVIGIATLVLVFLLAQKVIKSMKFALFFTLFIGLDILLFAWERLLLPEALTIMWLISVTLLFIPIIQSNRPLSLPHALILLFTFLVGFLLRPTYLFFPLVTLVFLSVLIRRKEIYIKSILICIIFYGTVAGYAVTNIRSFGYPGISRVSDINMIGKVLKHKLSPESGKSDDFWYEKVKEYQNKNLNPHPYRFIDYYGVSMQKNRSAFDTMGPFAQKVIKSQFPVYIIKTAQEVPPALLETGEELRFPAKPVSRLEVFLSALVFLYSKVQYLTLAVLPLFLIVLYRFIKHPTQYNIFCVLLGLICTYQILFTVLFAYGDYGRLINVAHPIMYLFLAASILPLFPKKV